MARYGVADFISDRERHQQFVDGAGRFMIVLMTELEQGESPKVADEKLGLPDDQIEDWNTLALAMSLGWVDPGFTEPFRDTLKRARDYLDALPPEGNA